MSRQVGGLGTAVYNPGGTSLSIDQHDWTELRPWSVGRLLGQTVDAERGMARRARDDRVQRHGPEGSCGFDRGAGSDSDFDSDPDVGCGYVDHDHGHFLAHPDGDGAVDWHSPGPGPGGGRGRGPVGGRS